MNPIPKDLFYVKHKWYSLTLNPCDKYQYLGCVNRFKKFIDMINELFIHYPSIGIHYVFWIELSEPRELSHLSAGSRLHIHGKIKMFSQKAVRTFLLQELYKLSRYGQLKIDTISNEILWEDYCKKQQKIIDTSAITNMDEYRNDP